MKDALLEDGKVENISYDTIIFVAAEVPSYIFRVHHLSASQFKKISTVVKHGVVSVLSVDFVSPRAEFMDFVRGFPCPSYQEAFVFKLDFCCSTGGSAFVYIYTFRGAP